MLRSVFFINVKRNGNILRVSPSSLERLFSTGESNDDCGNKQKDFQEKNTLTAEDSSRSGTTSKIPSKEQHDIKHVAAKKKLLSLLSEIKVDQERPQKISSDFTLARAVKRPSKEERFKDVIKKTKISPQEKLQLAIKNVAESVSGDPEQTKLELNEKLQSLNMTSTQPTEDSKVEEIKEEVIDEEMKNNIMSSVKEVAATVIDTTPSFSPKSELTQRLLKLSLDSKSSSFSKKSFENLLKGMKIDEKEIEQTQDTVQRKQRSVQQRIIERPKPQSSLNIFQSPTLDIFTVSEETIIDSKKTVWQILEEKNLKLLVQFAPRNGFEEMILWTEQGKHWKFPIDNMTEMGDEESVGFNEHVFLEEHLHGFPTKGPIRIFMEYVVVGLSLNPYITVERKIENINWFRDYFKEKEEILKEYGALG